MMRDIQRPATPALASLRSALGGAWRRARARILRPGPGLAELEDAPLDPAMRQEKAERLLGQPGERHALGTAERSRFILRLIHESFPTPVLAAAYFDNLERLLQRMPKRAGPGTLAVGIGSGRCGSTTLTGLLRTVPRSCCTHEVPPLIDWQPRAEQVDFHLRRFELLLRYHDFVFDASHWWLNALDRLFSAFPTCKVVGLWRDTEGCARSFAKIKGAGRGSINHWVAGDNGIWHAALWDRTYPHYPIPAGADADPDAARHHLIRRYVDEYNAAMFALVARQTDRVLLLRTEQLDDRATQQRLFDFFGLPGDTSSIRLNVGTSSDGREQYRL